MPPDSEGFQPTVPKEERHLPLVGSASPATVAALAARDLLDRVPTSGPDMAEMYRYRDFPHPAVNLGRGRTLLWLRPEIVKWARKTGRAE